MSFLSNLDYGKSEEKSFFRGAADKSGRVLGLNARQIRELEGGMTQLATLCLVCSGACLSALLINKQGLKKRENDPAMALGFLLGHIFAISGLNTYLHEVVGHEKLGMGLTSTKMPADTRYSIHAWEDFQLLVRSEKPQDKVELLSRILMGNRGGSISMTPEKLPPPNAIGRLMGKEGRGAWFDLAGSLPCLGVDVLATATGALLLKRNTAFALALMVFAIYDSTRYALYPASAAFMTPKELEREDKGGNDFAGFALHMSRITGSSPNKVAISTTLFFSTIVPLTAALIMYVDHKAKS